MVKVNVLVFGCAESGVDSDTTSRRQPWNLIGTEQVIKKYSKIIEIKTKELEQSLPVALRTQRFDSHWADLDHALVTATDRGPTWRPVQFFRSVNLESIKGQVVMVREGF